MTALASFLRAQAPAGGQPPWPQARVDATGWAVAGERLAAGVWSLLGLWGEPAAVHLAAYDPAGSAFGILRLDCPDGRFPSVGRLHAPAQRPERAIRDLYGLVPDSAPDTRPWLDHGAWGCSAPLAATPQPAIATDSYAFLPAEGEALHQIPVGPVHAGIIEPGHFRFSASGETVVRLEARLGYVHKGIDGLLAGASLSQAAMLAGRTSGDSIVAYGLAFARAAEAALGIAAPARAHWLRALMAELERLANHLGDIGAVCNDAAFAPMHAHCGILRELVLRACDAAFGHRLMRDLVLPGGLACDLDAAGAAAIRALCSEIGRRFPPVVELYDATASLQNRTVTTGIVTAALADRFAAGGFVGRASGRAFDARRSPGYPPYDLLDFDVPVLTGGDVNARVWLRVREVEQSLSLVAQILDRLPGGPVKAGLPAAPPPSPTGAEACEGAALVEGFRGDVLAWLRLAPDGRVERCHLRDPSWFQWPLLEAAVEGNIVADFPLCNKSFNCSYSGHDL